jgi:hypothetical protein
MRVALVGVAGLSEFAEEMDLSSHAPRRNLRPMENCSELCRLLARALDMIPSGAAYRLLRHSMGFCRRAGMPVQFKWRRDKNLTSIFQTIPG